ncbi:MAG: XRE family transcriptional regulator, partial [Comamonadaceae bacterium]
MPSKAPVLQPTASVVLGGLGASIRQRRKALRVSAGNAAEAAGMSRVTLHRIERGEASVTMGAYANAMAALGVQIRIVDATAGVA